MVLILNESWIEIIFLVLGKKMDKDKNDKKYKGKN